jgi:adenylate kinase family enzyme
MNKLNFIVLTGRFAAGKDTQAVLLVKKLGEDTTEIISTGDIYRGAKLGTGEYGHFHHFVVPYIEDIDTRGKLLPDSVMTRIVQEVISQKVRDGKENFIFTGFPRTLGQLEYFDKMIFDLRMGNEVNNIFIEYEISDGVSKERTHRRRVEIEERGETPRPWDTNEGLAKRISTYYREIEPMIEKLREEDRLISINATRGINEIETETSIRLSKERS